MSSWDEWPETGAGKQRVRVSRPSEPVFLAAGLYEFSNDPKTGARVPTYTMVTAPPTEFLGTVHDRAPMVLLSSQYRSWLAGGDEAFALAGMHPNREGFNPPERRFLLARSRMKRRREALKNRHDRCAAA